MEKKVVYLERLFAILSIISFAINIILLIINCFIDVMYETLYVELFCFVFFLNQIIFIPGKFSINKREYQNVKLHKYQFWVAMIMLGALLATEIVKVSDTLNFCLFSGLLSIFLIIFSLQNFCYTYHYDKDKKLHFVRRLMLAIFLSSCILVVFLYSLVVYFRSIYV